MHRFYLPPSECNGSTLTLSEHEAHHGLNVLRLRAGERVVVLDGAGHEFLCETQKLSSRAVELAVVQRNAIPPLPYQLTLVQAIPKGKIIETIIQKAVELGVTRVAPLLSERVVARLDAGDAAEKVQKWRLIAIEAIKQSGSGWLPHIDPPLSPKAFLAQGDKFDLPLIASLQPGSRHPREIFKSFYAERQRKPQSVAVWVGPEGDFTPAEISAAKSAGALPITLGRLVLRSETAATYCLSVLNYELQSPE